jgi:4-amino-4-deoxy-L-arabinose transferase-like glycosyltransferase
MIRDLASRIISEDTTYYAYKNDLKVSDANNDFVGIRSAHWKFTEEIFLKEYNLRQKIFGGGFSFLSWFSYYFSGDKTKDDYPHNPFLSVLLYSGIFGLIIYLFLFYKVITYYIRYRKEYPLLLYCFLVVFFFSFFSGGSPLDPPIMGFFIVLPFVLHNIHKKNNHLKGVPVNENEKHSHHSS